MKEPELLKKELTAPIASVRIFALEEILKTGGNKETLELLKKLKPLEKNEECLLLFSYAISKLESDNKKEQILWDKEFTPEKFWNSFSKVRPLKKLQLLSNI